MSLFHAHAHAHAHATAEQTQRHNSEGRRPGCCPVDGHASSRIGTVGDQTEDLKARRAAQASLDQLD